MTSSFLYASRISSNTNVFCVSYLEIFVFKVTVCWIFEFQCLGVFHNLKWEIFWIWRKTMVKVRPHFQPPHCTSFQSNLLEGLIETKRILPFFCSKVALFASYSKITQTLLFFVSSKINLIYNIANSFITLIRPTCMQI